MVNNICAFSHFCLLSAYNTVLRPLPATPHFIPTMPRKVVVIYCSHFTDEETDSE